MRYTVTESEPFTVMDSDTPVISYPDRADAERFAARLNRKVQKVADVLPAMPTAAALRMADEIDRQRSAPPEINIPDCELLEEIDRPRAERLLANDAYWLQLKANGKRCRILKAQGKITGLNKRGERIALPPALAAFTQALPFASLLIDGELMPGGHYIAYELLAQSGIEDLPTRAYSFRFYELLTLLKDAPAEVIEPIQTWFTEGAKKEGLAELEAAKVEGAVFKKADAPFRPGRNGQHLKYKFVKSLTAKIIPKNAKDEAKGHESAALGLSNGNGKWVEVAHASLIGKIKLVPAAQRSGWQWLGKHVEVEYLMGYGTKAAPRLVQPRIVAVRDDTTDRDCALAQVQFHQGQGEK